jgi:hypothetical protein
MVKIISEPLIKLHLQQLFVTVSYSRSFAVNAGREPAASSINTSADRPHCPDLEN